MILIAIEKVKTGKSLDTYRTHWLVEFNWLGFLVFMVVLLVALAIGVFLQLKERLEIKHLLEKYSGDTNK